jgi:hypothetical protein
VRYAPFRPTNRLPAKSGDRLERVQFVCGSRGFARLAPLGHAFCLRTWGYDIDLTPHTRLIVSRLTEDLRREFGLVGDRHDAVVDEATSLRFGSNSLCLLLLPLGVRLEIRSVSPNMPGGDRDGQILPDPIARR